MNYSRYPKPAAFYSGNPFSDPPTDFLASVRSTHSKSQNFWDQPICKIIGNIEVRPGFCENNEVDIYFMKKENGGKYLPSIITLTRQVAREFCSWGKTIMAEIDSTPEDEVIASLENEFAFLNKSDTNFWKCPGMFASSTFRARVYKDQGMGFYKFVLNSPRASAEYENWKGPAIVASKGEFRKLVAAILDFEEKFETT